MQVASIGLIVLVVAMGTILWIQAKSELVARYRVPMATATARLITGVERSISQLRVWVMLGSSESTAQRQRSWSNEISPALREIQGLLSDPEDLVRLESVKANIERLRVSQWWVEDLSRSVGNIPSRLIYERDLLLILHRIQSSILGLNEIAAGEDGNVYQIQLAVALAHQSLSEGVRRLSEVVRTGRVVEIDEFQQQADEVNLKLRSLSAAVPDQGSTRDLLNWIIREYSVYELFAEAAVSARQSDDWNRALYLLRTETSPLAEMVLEQLNELQDRHLQLLKEDVRKSALAARLGAAGLFALIVAMILAAIFAANLFAKRLAIPIQKLSTALMNLGQNEIREIENSPNIPHEIAQLNQRFNEMSVELSRRRSELEYANQELQTYTHVITHDLKPPLINLRGHSELIQQAVHALTISANDGTTSELQLGDRLKKIDAELLQSTQYIRLSLAKMNTLIGGVLENSKLLFRAINPQPIDLNELVRNVVAMHSHRHDLRFDIGELPPITTDRFSIEHVFTNLIDNAVKFLRAESVGVIGISAICVKQRCLVTIEDNGRGLPDGVDVFQLFKQGDPRIEGAGIGLSLTRTVLSRIGGSISCRNKDQGGARFQFTIPLNYQ